MNELRKNYLLKHLTNETRKEYVISVEDGQEITFRGTKSLKLFFKLLHFMVLESMSEVKASVEVASKMIELFKNDDTRLLAVLQEIEKKFEAINVKTLELENRITKYNQRQLYTQQLSQTYQRFFKRSKDREIVEQEFLPINVHLQQFSIANQVLKSKKAP